MPKKKTKTNRPFNRNGQMDIPEPMPEFSVKVTEINPLLLTIQVKNLDTGIAATTTCGPDSDQDAIVQDLKERLYHA